MAMQPELASRRIVLALTSAALFMDVVVYSMVIPLLPTYGATYQLGQIQLGMLLTAYAAGLFVATPAVARICDHHGRTWPFLIGLLGLGAASALFAVADSYPDLLFARVLQGAASGGAWTAGLALVADHYPERQRGSAIGLAMGGNALGMLLGPVFGGVAGEFGGIALPFWCAAGLAALLLALAWQQRQLLGRARQPAAKPTLALLRDRRIRAALLALLAITGSLTMIEPTLPLYLAERFDAGATLIGLQFAAITSAFAVGSPLAGRVSDRVGPLLVCTAGMLALAAMFPLLTLPTTLIGQTLVFFLLGCAAAFAINPTLPLLAGLVVTRGLGGFATAFALFNLAYALGMTIGPAAGSVLAALFGLTSALVITAVALLLALPLPGHLKKGPSPTD